MAGKRRLNLSENQWEWLEHADVHPFISPGSIGASSAVSLVRRGLLLDMQYGRYRITQAGIDALTERNANAPASGLRVVTAEGQP